MLRELLTMMVRMYVLSLPFLIHCHLTLSPLSILLSSSLLSSLRHLSFSSLLPPSPFPLPSSPLPFSPGLLDLLNKMNTTLEAIQKSLDMYLETKRQCFPRFYFLSNDDLLEILGQSKNPEAVRKT